MDRVDELNGRLNDRQFGTHLLEPVFDPRPVNTKGGLMPVSATHTQPNTEYFSYEMYNPEKMFHSNIKRGTFRKFAENINSESELRNQYFAHQRCEKKEYIPDSSSDMYNMRVPEKGVAQCEVPHTHPGLFKSERFNNFNPAPHNETQVFNNNTNQSIKDI